ncbi:hypothetical protein JXA32_08510 [Candidatus Sumerlaeota bacterium]|nr:hypothetical protein [Candidatus Sumerlaeota bacterium]
MSEPIKNSFFSRKISLCRIIDALLFLGAPGLLVLAHFWTSVLQALLPQRLATELERGTFLGVIVFFTLVAAWVALHGFVLGYLLWRTRQGARMRGELVRDPKFLSRSVSLLRMGELVFLGLVLPGTTFMLLAMPFIGDDYSLDLDFFIFYYMWAGIWAAIIAAYLPGRISGRVRACTERDMREQLALTLVEPREYFQAFFRVHTTLSWFLQYVFVLPLIMLFCAPFYLRFFQAGHRVKILEWIGPSNFLLLGWVALNALALLFLLNQNFLPWLIRRRVNPKHRRGNVFIDTARWVLLVHPVSVALALGLPLVCGGCAEFIAFWFFDVETYPGAVTLCVLGVLLAVINVQLFRLLRENWRQAHAAVFAMDGDAEVHQTKKWKLRERLAYLSRLGCPRTLADWQAQLTVLLMVVFLFEAVFFCGWGWRYPGMYAAIRMNDAARLEALLKDGFELKRKNRWLVLQDKSIMDAAVMSNHERIVQLALEYADAKTVQLVEPFIIHFIIRRDRLDLLELMLDKGYDPNNQGRYGRTMLMNLILNRGFSAQQQAKAAKILIEHGADVNEVSQYGSLSPLQGALLVGNTTMAEILIEHGVTISDKQLTRCFQIRSLNTNAQASPELVRNLIKDPSAIDENGDTWLLRIMGGTRDAMSPANPSQFSTIASQRSNQTARLSPEFTAILLEDGADVNQRGENARGLTPLCLAVEKSDWDGANWLIEHGADINKRSKEGYAPLHVAILIQDDLIVGDLLQQGADPSLAPEDGSGMTMEAFVTQYGTEEIQQLMTHDPSNTTTDTAK